MARRSKRNVEVETLEEEPAAVEALPAAVPVKTPEAPPVKTVLVRARTTFVTQYGAMKIRMNEGDKVRLPAEIGRWLASTNRCDVIG